jgi:hypothetical protein
MPSDRITFRFEAAHVGLNQDGTVRLIALLKAAGDGLSRAAADELEAAVLAQQPVTSRLGVVEADALRRVVEGIVADGNASPQLVRLRDALQTEYGDPLEYDCTPAAE